MLKPILVDSAILLNVGQPLAGSLLWFGLGFQVLGVGYELAKCLDIQSAVVSTISLIVRESTCSWRFIS